MSTLEKQLVHELIRLDEKKTRRDKHWNRYFLGIALRSLEGFDDDVTAGMSAEQAFTDRFTPCREMHAIARALNLNLDVERGQWVAKEA